MRCVQRIRRITLRGCPLRGGDVLLGVFGTWHREVAELQMRCEIFAKRPLVEDRPLGAAGLAGPRSPQQANGTEGRMNSARSSGTVAPLRRKIVQQSTAKTISRPFQRAEEVPRRRWTPRAPPAARRRATCASRSRRVGRAGARGKSSWGVLEFDVRSSQRH